MMPGLKGTAAMPGGIFWASERVGPSIGPFVAPKGWATGSVEGPHPELKLTTTRGRMAIMAGTKWRMTLATPLMLISMMSENSCAPTFHNGALRLMMAALFNSRCGGTKVFNRRLAQDLTSE